MLIKTITGKTDVYTDANHYGVEVEVEYLNNVYHPDLCTTWRIINDGSLRHVGVEYTTWGAKNKKTVYKELDLLRTFLDVNTHVVNSPRTSIHVHYNTSHMDMVEVMKMSCAYWIIEDTLYELFGDQRKSSPFCIPLSTSEEYIELIVKAFNNSNTWRGVLSKFERNRCKYSGLNLSCLSPLNTIEFRGMNGGEYNMEFIKDWLAVIHDFRVLTEDYANPQAMLDEFYSMTGKEIINKIVGGEGFIKDRLLDIETKEPTVRQSAVLVSDIAYHVDWTQKKEAGDPRNDVPNPRFRTALEEMRQIEAMFVDGGAGNIQPRPRAEWVVLDEEINRVDFPELDERDDEL